MFCSFVFFSFRFHWQSEFSSLLSCAWNFCWAWHKIAFIAFSTLVLLNCYTIHSDMAKHSIFCFDIIVCNVVYTRDSSIDCHWLFRGNLTFGWMALARCTAYDVRIVLALAGCRCYFSGCWCCTTRHTYSSTHSTWRNMWTCKSHSPSKSVKFKTTLNQQYHSDHDSK